MVHMEPVNIGNPAVLEAHRGTFQEDLERALLQLDFIPIPKDAATGDQPPTERLILCLDEDRIVSLIEDLEIVRRLFPS